jgi:hypothetical protein
MRKVFFFLIAVILACFTACGTSKRIKTFSLPISGYEIYSRKMHNSLIGHELPALDSYLMKGHILVQSNGNDPTYMGYYVYSYEFYSYLRENSLEICKASSLSSVDDFINIFGTPQHTDTTQNHLLVLLYYPLILDSDCETCSYSNFSFAFDLTTRKRFCPY